MHKKFKLCWAQVFGMVALSAAAQSAAYAEDTSDRIEIHGYGQQAYLQTRDNPDSTIGNKGTWGNNALALLFVAKIDDKSKVWMLLDGDASKIKLDWAFVDYQLTNNLTGRVGQIKAPLGLYNEIHDTRFLHLSTQRPMLYQEVFNITYEIYRGVAAVYDYDLGSGRLSLDAYVGQEVDFEASSTSEVKNRSLAGGRLTYQTPLDGLKFMVSAYNNRKEKTSPAVAGTINSAIFSADYIANNWDLKAEYADQHNGLEGKKARTYYAQAGYTFDDKWTPFVRYDYITADVSQKFNPSYYQKSKVLGLNYKINDNIAVRLENHWNNGYALPNASAKASGSTISGTIKPDWNLFAASVNFIF